MSELDRLTDLASKLRPAQVKLLEDMARALMQPVDRHIDPASDLLNHEDLAVYFTNRLLLHHAVQEEKFTKKAFEYALRDACRAAGKRADLIINPTHPGPDIEVDRIKYSLKTEAGQSISEKSITISKLMEARWMRDCTTKEQFAQETATRVIEHLDRYDRILTLRAFDVYDFAVPDISNGPTLLGRLRNAEDSVSAYIKSRMTSDQKRKVDEATSNGALQDAELIVIVDSLNRILADGKLFDRARFGAIALSDSMHTWLDQMRKNDVIKIPRGNIRKGFNRALLEDAYAGQIRRSRRVRYELREIQRELLRKVANARSTDYENITKNNGISVSSRRAADVYSLYG